jgi:rod shape-determining protein MreC
MAPSNNRRPGFSRRAQVGLFVGYVFAVAGSIISAALLAFATFDPTAFAALRLTVSEITAPASTGLAVVGQGIRDVPGAVSDYLAVRQRNAALRKELSDAHALLMRARALSYENRRLKHLLAVRDRTIDPVATARLVSSTASSTRRFATLNAGFRQGVQAGQPVRGPEGLIGRVVESGPDTARVLLLADAESIIPVRRTRDGLPAIAAGRGDGLLEIRAANLADGAFEVGDVLITSGTGGIYGPGIPVARIVSRSHDTILARPFAIPDSLDYALVQKAFLPPMPAADAHPVAPK